MLSGIIRACDRDLYFKFVSREIILRHTSPGLSAGQLSSTNLDECVLELPEGDVVASLVIQRPMLLELLAY